MIVTYMYISLHAHSRFNIAYLSTQYTLYEPMYNMNRYKGCYNVLPSLLVGMCKYYSALIIDSCLL